MKIETQCLHEGYQPKNGEPSALPIVQSTTYRFDSTAHIADLFDMPTEFMYSRFANPTCDAVEKKIAALEGGAGAMLTSSGQAASLLSILNLCSAGDSFIAATTIYGGSINCDSVSRSKSWESNVFGQMQRQMPRKFKSCSSPIPRQYLEKHWQIRHSLSLTLKNGQRLHTKTGFLSSWITPLLLRISRRPISFGADIVIHSTSKYMDGHALQCGGVIVDSGKFDWAASGKFPDFTEPDESYHGVVYTRDFGALAYIIKARMQLMRDFGCYPAAHSAFLLNLGLETLALRMQRYCENAQIVAKHLQGSDKIAQVRYPGLESDAHHARARKYLPLGTSGVMSIDIKGGRETAMKFMDSLKLASNEVHVADIRTCVLHPASETHRQLTSEQLEAAGIQPGLVRLSVGLENVQDIIADLDEALAQL